MPVYLFALSQQNPVNWFNAAVVFVVLHLLVYPASNGYNSYMDRDTSPIGGLSHPLQPTKQLYYFTIAMDAMAVAASLLVSWVFALGILLYITASRAYSYRGIRLKQYPLAGFLTVFICQGALIFFLTYHATDPQLRLGVPLLPCITASLLIGALYPLTQVYQHKADEQDGVTTISMLLGKRGSFVFSMLLFLLATMLFYIMFQEQPNFFYLYLLILLPVVLFFLYWMKKVWVNGDAADFRHSLLMNILCTLCTTAFFITLIVLNH